MKDQDKLVEKVAEFAYNEWREGRGERSWAYVSDTRRDHFIRGARRALGLEAKP